MYGKARQVAINALISPNVARFDCEVISFNGWNINVIAGPMHIQRNNYRNSKIQTWHKAEVLKPAQLSNVVHRGYSTSGTYKILQDAPWKQTLSRNSTFIWCHYFKKAENRSRMTMEVVEEEAWTKRQWQIVKSALKVIDYRTLMIWVSQFGVLSPPLTKKGSETCLISWLRSTGNVFQVKVIMWKCDVTIWRFDVCDLPRSTDTW